jgi:hypothetical protein
MAASYPIRGDVIWPSDMLLPPRPPKLVYIDMLGIINLAKVKVGTAPTGYAELHGACLRARAEGRARFPMSATHVIELYNVRSVDQRRALAAVMEELSGLEFMLGRPQIQQLEVEAALNEIPGVNIPPQGPIALIGPSVLWAFGKRGNLITNSPDPDAMARHVLQQLGIEPDADPMAALTAWAERSLLTGPEDHDDPDLQAAGYTRQSWHDTLRRRATHEQDLVSMLDADPQLRTGRLRDLVNGLEMSNELIDILTSLTMPIGTSIVEMLDSDLDKLRDFSDSMPSTRVAVSIKERYHRDSRHTWTPNDMNDIDALSIAVPYCDAVFADKAARNTVEQSRELRIFGTVLPRTPQALTEWLDNQIESA